MPSGLQLGLVGYNTVPFLAEGPTLERDRVRSGIESLQADGGTATGDALAEALKRLQQRKDAQGRRAPAAIVLLSDGKSTDGRDPVEVARQAGRLGIPISTVALGTAEGVVPGGPFGAPLSVPPDPETLRQIAAASKGDAFQVGEAGQLNDVYRRLGSQLGTRREEREVTAGFAGAGLLLLLGAAALGTPLARAHRLGRRAARPPRGRGARRARGSCSGCRAAARCGRRRASATPIAATTSPARDEEREVVAVGQRRGARGAVGDAARRSASRPAWPARPGPSAPPTCAVVLTSPEARPASSGVAPDIASVMSEGNARPAPVPRSTIDGQDVGHVAAVDRRPREQQRARRRSARGPPAARRRAPKRVIRRSVYRTDSVPIMSVAGRKARPISRAS